MKPWTLACIAAAVLAAPAHADVTYMGMFNAIITSGEDVISAPFPCGCESRTDLTGMPITVSFSVYVAEDYDNGFGDILPQFVDASSLVFSGLPPTVYFAAAGTSDVFLDDSDASFSGDAASAVLRIIDLSRQDANANYGFDLSYSGASAAAGPVSGSGRAEAYEPGFGTPDHIRTFNFRLVSGSVTAVGPGAAVPEPATWALMIGGVAMAGGALRRRAAVRTKLRFA